MLNTTSHLNTAWNSLWNVIWQLVLLQLVLDFAQKMDGNWPLTAVEKRVHLRKCLERMTETKYQVFMFLNNKILGPLNCRFIDWTYKYKSGNLTISTLHWRLPETLNKCLLRECFTISITKHFSSLSNHILFKSAYYYQFRSCRGSFMQVLGNELLP